MRGISRYTCAPARRPPGRTSGSSRSNSSRIANGPEAQDRGYYHSLELDNTVGAPAFCLFPDMPGGTFQEKDEESRVALARSHAWGLLVDGARYVGSGVKAKNYRDDVHD